MVVAIVAVNVDRWDCEGSIVIWTGVGVGAWDFAAQNTGQASFRRASFNADKLTIFDALEYIP